MEGTILIVDDEVKITEILKAYLENAGFDTLIAYDGKSALERVRTKNPDLVILDLMLPDISGEEVCKRIRGESNVPVIMLTARAEDSDMIEGLGTGALIPISKASGKKLSRIEATPDILSLYLA